MFRKIKLLTLIAALAVFAFPWLEVRCSGTPLGTQSGIQMMHGGGRAVDPLELRANAGTESIRVGAAPLVIIAFVAVAFAGLVALKAFLRSSVQADRLVIVLSTLALIMLLVQALTDPPVKRELDASVGGSLTEVFAGGFGELEGELREQSAVRVRMLPAFYLELALLAVPLLGFANFWLDRSRREAGEVRGDL